MGALKTLVIALLATLACHPTLAQPSPPDRQPVTSPPPPAIKRARIQPNTPLERQEFLDRRKTHRGLVENVPPLPAQVVSPDLARRQR
jgi:hypothetical protein